MTPLTENCPYALLASDYFESLHKCSLQEYSLNVLNMKETRSDFVICPKRCYGNKDVWAECETYRAGKALGSPDQPAENGGE